jgi:hypothetical protein
VKLENLSQQIKSKKYLEKMEVVRDALWEECLSNAVTMYRLSEPDDKCYNLADATWKLKVAYMKHQHKRDTRKIVVLEKKPEVVNEQRTSKKICCALTMSGKPCSFKAVCGDYCKKHNVKHSQLGTKGDVSQIKII